MVNHFWDGEHPAMTACRGDFIGPSTVPHVSSTEWRGVSCPDCLGQQPTTEVARVEWDEALDGLLDEVSHLMTDRHKKYGPGNIAKHGLTGISVRLDDKLARIDTGDMDHADEKYRDAWLDVVGYGLIALMWIDGNWPGSTPNPPHKPGGTA